MARGTYHYLPILTMGLALFIAYLKTVSFLGREDRRRREVVPGRRRV